MFNKIALFILIGVLLVTPGLSLTGCKKSSSPTTVISTTGSTTTTAVLITTKATKIVLTTGDCPIGWSVTKQPASAVKGFPSNSCLASLNTASQTLQSLAAVYSSANSALKQLNTELTNTLKTISVNKVNIGDGGFICQSSKGTYTVKFTKNNVYAYVITTGLSYSDSITWANTLAKKIR